ncbi:uncharacterized protein LOC110846518 [Folsomia candida]|uniref:uncharacterized protein LOC110846518 n=1 Tax=Folsomia candida TaxID=158441 RepID=UPI000B8F3EAF|nr:uncharacterized protein LOC110846518 [Folsomia candida]XP_021948991.1 uncharacterized protein LOC110846518 [Folsomia candida]XP_035706023.1 uncharacterized protein LOC110846518 [Folsomia candida]
MDSTWLESRTPPVTSGSSMMDMSTNPYSSSARGRTDYIPAWKVPISKSFSSVISTSEERPSSESGLGSGGERDHSTSSSSDPESVTPANVLNSKGVGDTEEASLIQILLPCIICNRTFSPDALERHSKVCTKVNVKTPYKPDRGKFDSTEQRKKGTKVEYFIPPPDTTGDTRLSASSSGFSRGSKNRSSLRGTSCTTRSTLSSEALLSLHQQPSSLGQNPSSRLAGATSPLRRQRSMSQTRGERGHSKPPSEYLFNDDNHSEFGSNSEESHGTMDPSLPSYAKPLVPTDECPFCNRCFGFKAFDRHVEYCKEKYVQRQYEVQPTPKEKIEAMERQEIRTKYRPIKGSSSCTSLRSVSPGKDFASMAYKLFGLRRTDGASNLYNNQLTNFKKSKESVGVLHSDSNESLTNSCYGDFTRGMRRPSPSPSKRGGNAMSVTNKINNLLSKTFHYQQNSSNNNYLAANNNSSGPVHPMKINTSSNIPKLAKSSDNLAMMMNNTGIPYGHVSSSGYGQPQQQVPQQASNSFNRNSRSRSSLHKNFFRSKRVEPEGTENTGSNMMMTNSGGGGGEVGGGKSSSSGCSSPLIITPMTFYTKANKTNHHQELFRPKGTTLLTQDPSYDPYEMAEKQLEELLKSQPINKNVNKKTARKLGLEKAFESVGVVHSDSFHTNMPSRHDMLGGGGDPNVAERKDNDQFVFDLPSGKMDDSYWDEILKKSRNASSSEVGGRDRQPENSQMSMSTSSETKSQQSDNSSFGDVNKSRALSQISSADSGFSRSGGVTDPEFEALESMVGEESAMRRGGHSHESGRNPLSSTHSLLLSNRTPFVRRTTFTQNQGKEPESPMQISPAPLTPSVPTRNESSSSDVFSPGPGSGARFCHECGNSYPSSIAKFCPECGERRVFKF